MPQPNRLVAALIYDDLCNFEFSCAAEVFGLPRPELGPGWYRFKTVAAEPGNVKAKFGFRVQADAGLDELPKAGTVVVPGWTEALTAPERPVRPEIVRALRAAYDAGARLVSVCSGSWLLAATGLLDGKRATAHWKYIDAFRRTYPHVEWDADALYIDEGQILTSAGSAAGLDACLHLVRRDFGTKIANHLARRLVVQPHRDGGQTQFIEQPVSAPGRNRVAIALQELSRNLHAEMRLDAVARKCAMSERTLIRQFRQKTGMAPADWLARARVDRARELLETTALPVDVIATECGLGSAANLRHHFRRKVGISPTEYRARFGERQPTP